MFQQKNIMSCNSPKTKDKSIYTLATRLRYIIIVTLLTFLAACHDDDSPAAEQAHLKVKIKDATNHYDALYLNMEEIWTRTSSGAGKIRANKRLNILSIEKDSLIATGHVPHGTIHEVILQLATEGNEIVVDGASHKLETPEGRYIPILIPTNNQLIANQIHTLFLEFDLSKFIERTENGKYLINPIIDTELQDNIQ